MSASHARVMFVLALSACGGAAPTASVDRDAPALAYEVAIDAALETMRVEVCPRGAHLPAALVPTHEEGRAHVVGAALVLDGHVTETPATDGRIDLTEAPADACVRYDVDLASCVTAHGPAGCARAGRDLFAPTSTWLLGPETRQLAARYELHFTLPDGVFVTPIAAAGADEDPVILDDRSFSFVTYVAFTHNSPTSIAAPGSCIDLVTLDGSLDASLDAQTRWLRQATSASTRVTGRAPFDRITALVVPSLDVPGMPVLFGVAGRGMRPSVTLLVGGHASEAELVPDWTAVHELSHFLTAYLEGEDTWLSEGLATYYQEVLRAREGLVSETDAWAALESGFARGRAECTSGTLREASSTMHTLHRYAHVYWAGAALVLLADVAYRRAGTSLDEAVERAWAHRTERATAEELLLWLDGEPNGIFASLARTALDAEGFPDLSAANDWLGVVEGENAVITLREDAPGAAVRVAMMNVGSPVPSNPSTCDGESAD